MYGLPHQVKFWNKQMKKDKKYTGFYFYPGLIDKFKGKLGQCQGAAKSVTLVSLYLFVVYIFSIVKEVDFSRS